MLQSIYKPDQIDAQLIRSFRFVGVEGQSTVIALVLASKPEGLGPQRAAFLMTRENLELMPHSAAGPPA